MRGAAATLLLIFFSAPILYAQKLLITPSETTIIEGDSGEFTVALSSEPTGDVTITIVRLSGAEISLNVTELIFNSSNWNQPQTVTMTAEHDADSEDGAGSLILIASGGGYEISGGGVFVQPDTVRIESLGTTIQLEAVIYDQDGASIEEVDLEWLSADPSIAVVDTTGKVTGVGLGETTIMATLATASGSATILVDGSDSTPSSDREILETLYKVTGGENWFIQDNWMTNTPLHTWYGVHTDVAGYVTALELGTNNLTGPIPPELGKLTRLKELTLAHNSLTGSIPPELGDLAQLERLYIYSNELIGPLPPELGNLTQLKSLITGTNHLEGPIPPEFGNMVQLEELIMTDNALTGPIPPLGNLGNLREMILWSNSLSGEVPSELGGLENLRNLVLWSNQLTGQIPPELANLSQLTILDLDWNQLTGSIPPELGNLRQLKTISLVENSLTGSIPPELGRLTELEQLKLTSNQFTGIIPSELGSLRNLIEFKISENKLTGSIPSELGSLSQLKQLWLSNNQLTGSIPSELGNLSQLTTLDLGHNQITGSIPPKLGSLIGLTGLFLRGNQLTGLIPPKLGSLINLTYLDLGKNQLTGLLPPELGDLAQLQRLWAYNNQLTGSIPPEFGNLAQLNTLGLDGNSDMQGFIPRSMLGLNPESIYVHETGICIQQDSIFLKWWNLIPIRNHSNCSPVQIDYLALMELYHRTNGPSWVNTAGWGSDNSLDTWHGVSVENGRVVELSLQNNGLEGSIPSEVSNLTALRVLNLTGNLLSGAFPESISFMSELAELRISNNSELTGVFTDALSNLTNLEVFHFENTSLCVSPGQRFQRWYTSIGDVSGIVCSNPSEIRLDVPVAYLTQSIQTQENTVRLIEGRDALLRVFITTDVVPAFFEPRITAKIRGGGKMHQVEMTREGDRLALEVDESHLDNSFNAVIPGDVITRGATLVVEADPEGVIPRAPGSQDRYPATGEANLNVVSVPDMELTVVPVLEATEPERSVIEWADKIDDNSSEVALLKHAFPFHGFRAKSRDSYVTSLDLTSEGWNLILELEALRMLDNATGYYYGAAASVNGYVRGIARLGGWVSMGKAWDTELAHEVGHSLNLLHAPCGEPDGLDSEYPYAGGSVGVGGYDFHADTLISPHYHKDIMGYCYDQGWLSDYFFEKVIDYREEVEGKAERRAAGVAQAADVLVLWGGVQDGNLRIEPPFSATAPVQLPEADGPYQLEGFGGNEVLFSLSFTPGRDKFGDRYFFFAIQIEEGWEESMDQIVLTGPEGSVTVNTNDQRTLSIIRDEETGQVRGILRDWEGELPSAFGDPENLRITTFQNLTDSVRL